MSDQMIPNDSGSSCSPWMKEMVPDLWADLPGDMGQHFFKITGPADSVDKLKDGFRQMLEGLEVKK